MTSSITIHRALSEEFYSDVLITAFDGSVGGSWYWARPQTGSWLSARNPDGGRSVWTSVSIIEQEPQEFEGCNPDGMYTVTHETVRKGIQELLDSGSIRDDLLGQIMRSVLEDEADIDADAADCIVQQGLFGEVVYG